MTSFETSPHQDDFSSSIESWLMKTTESGLHKEEYLGPLQEKDLSSHDLKTAMVDQETRELIERSEEITNIALKVFVLTRMHEHWPSVLGSVEVFEQNRRGKMTSWALSIERKDKLNQLNQTVEIEVHSRPEELKMDIVLKYISDVGTTEYLIRNGGKDLADYLVVENGQPVEDVEILRDIYDDIANMTDDAEVELVRLGLRD